jgi:hypothetical protein
MEKFYPPDYVPGKGYKNRPCPYCNEPHPLEWCEGYTAFGNWRDAGSPGLPPFKGDGKDWPNWHKRTGE